MVGRLPHGTSSLGSLNVSAPPTAVHPATSILNWLTTSLRDSSRAGSRRVRLAASKDAPPASGSEDPDSDERAEPWPDLEVSDTEAATTTELAL